MGVSVVTYRKGGTREAVVVAAARGREVFKRHGADNFLLNQVVAGADTGQWAIVISFKDWASFGSVMQAVSQDPAFLEFIAGMEAASELVSRRILTGVE